MRRTSAGEFQSLEKLEKVRRRTVDEGPEVLQFANVVVRRPAHSNLGQDLLAQTTVHIWMFREHVPCHSQSARSGIPSREQDVERFVPDDLRVCTGVSQRSTQRDARTHRP